MSRKLSLKNWNPEDTLENFIYFGVAATFPIWILPFLIYVLGSAVGKSMIKNLGYEVEVSLKKSSL